MNGKPWRVVMDEWLDIVCAGDGQHLGGRNRHVFAQCILVFAPGAMNLERGNAPGVNFLLIEFDIVIAMRQTLSISKERKLPRARAAHRFLELWPESALCDAALPALSFS